MARRVRVQATRDRQASCHQVEALDSQQRVQRFVTGGGQGEVTAGHVGRCGQQYIGTTAAHFVGQGYQAGLLGATRGENQQRVAIVHQRHRAVLDFGTGERFGLDDAGFLELQGGFQRHGKAQATAYHHDAFGRYQHVQRAAPVLAGGVGQVLGQVVQRGQQGGVLLPVRHQAGYRRQGGDIAFGGGHAFFFASAQRHRPFAGSGQRGIGLVDQRHGTGTGLAKGSHGVDQVRAAAGLRQGHGQLAFYIERCLMQREQRHGQRDHRRAGALHRQVGEIVGRMVRAAACHSQCQLWRRFGQFARQDSQPFIGIHVLGSYRLGGKQGFIKH